MAMGSSGTGTSVSEINVTPLIDVLLVLLIIFMVIVPVTPKGLSVLVPQPPKTLTPDRPIVVQVLGSNGSLSYRINQDSFSKDMIPLKLAGIFAARQDKVMFVKADPGLEYGQVAEVIDFGHRAGVESVGIITPRVEAGQ